MIAGSASVLRMNKVPVAAAVMSSLRARRALFSVRSTDSGKLADRARPIDPVARSEPSPARPVRSTISSWLPLKRPFATMLVMRVP
jgi:hypothetical protein